MKVKLISYTAFPQNLISVAAKLCYSEKSIDKVIEKTTDENAEKFVENLLDFGHESPIEHVSFTFAVEGVSRSLLAQITRHRIASFSVRSQRYVSEENFSFVTPPEIENDEEAKEVFLSFIKNSKDCYNKLLKILTKNSKEKLVKSGVREDVAEKRASKKAAEDSRFVLPNACETQFIVTMNARSLLNFFRLRCCNRAQWEINNLACLMLKLVYPIAPAIFKHAGPACVFEGCREGKMSCRQAEKVKEKFKNLKRRKDGKVNCF